MCLRFTCNKLEKPLSLTIGDLFSTCLDVGDLCIQLQITK